MGEGAASVACIQGNLPLFILLSWAYFQGVVMRVVYFNGLPWGSRDLFADPPPPRP